MPKQDAEQVVEKLLAVKNPASKSELRTVVDLVLAQGGSVVTGYDDDGGYCGTRVPGHHVGHLVGDLVGKGFVVKVFPYGVPVIDEAFLQIGRPASGS